MTTNSMIKKIGLGLLAIGAFAALAIPANSIAQTAQARFNDVAGAGATLQVSNYTQNPGCSSCWGSSVTAKIGDVISFDIFYVNTAWDTNTTAYNTTTGLGSSPTATGFRVSGGVQASNAAPAVGSVNVEVTGGTNPRLTFVGGEHYVAGNRVGSASPSMTIGDVQPGWPYAGDVVLRYQVTGDVTPTCTKPSVTTGSASAISATSATISGSATADSANPITKTWFEIDTQNPMRYSLNDSGGSATGVNLTPDTTYYYRYVAQNNCGTSYGSTLTFKTSPQTPTCTAASASATSATSVTANSALLQGTVSGTAPITYYFEYGTDGVNFPNKTATQTSSGGAVSASVNGLLSNTNYYYRLVVSNNCGNTTSNIVQFQTPPGGGCTGPGCGGGCTAGNPSATTGGSSSVTQTSAVITGIASNYTSAQFEYGTSQSLGQTAAYNGGAATLSGLSPDTTYYYRVSASNSCGSVQGSILSFKTLPATPTCTLGAPSATVNQATISGTTATITGTVTNAASYYLAYGTDPNNLVNTTATQSGNTAGSMNVSFSIPNLQQGVTYYYRIVVQNCNSTQYSGTLSFNTTAACTLPLPSASVNQATVSGSTATITGTVYNATSYYLAYGTDPNNLVNTTATQSGNSSGSLSVNFTIPNVQAGTTYYYRIVVQNCAGTQYSAILSFGGGSTCTLPLPSASVNQATLNGNTATITGTVYNATSYYLAYGTDPNNLVNTTATQSGNSSGSTSVVFTLNNLQSNTTYYYRIVIQNCAGTAYSSTLSFGGGGSCNLPVPTVSVNAATNVTNYSATVNGYVQNASSWYFRYGTDGNNMSYTSPTQSGSGSVSYTLSNLQSGVTYYFQLVAQNCAGTVSSTVMSFFTTGGNQGNPPLVTTLPATGVTQNSAVLNGQVNPNGGDNTIGWFEYGLSQYGLAYTTNSVSVGSGNYYQNISQLISSLSPNTTYYFRAAARNNNGTAYGQVLSFTTPGGGYTPTQQPPTVITLPATNIGQTSALLNCQVNPQGSMTTQWFEYGSSVSLGLVTPQQPVGNGTQLYNCAFPVTGLSPNTTYYFRAVGQNGAGTAYGQILSFATTGGGGTTVIRRYGPPTIITQVIGGGIGGSCLSLTPSINQNLVPGGEFIYGVTYRNDCPFPLQNATLRIYLPNEVDFSSTNHPFLTRDMNTITYALGTVPVNFQDTVLVRGLVKQTTPPGANLIFKSDLSFTDPKGAFQSVSAFLNATVGALAVAGIMTGTGAASILDALRALFSSGWFWFLLFLLLLAIFIFWLATRRRADEIEHV